MDTKSNANLSPKPVFMNALAKNPVTTMSHTTSFVIALIPCVNVSVFVASATVNAPNAHAPIGIGFSTKPVTVLTNILNKSHAGGSSAAGHPIPNRKNAPTPTATSAFVTFNSSASSTTALVVDTPPAALTVTSTVSFSPSPSPFDDRIATRLARLVVPRASPRHPIARSPPPSPPTASRRARAPTRTNPSYTLRALASHVPPLARRRAPTCAKRVAF
mmetsp:Transcript_8415/g.33471  ORF Transcript_8415/g.33471 Transcript_8415/m.33471 type:complete len:218 (-) Transcript_8415:122-775(-)